jgi:hypothetical protein
MSPPVVIKRDARQARSFAALNEDRAIGAKPDLERRRKKQQSSRSRTGVSAVLILVAF